MSRDQRPARVKMIDAEPAATPMRRAGDRAGPVAEPAAAAIPAPKAGAILGSLLFLLACVAGAAGVALLSLLGAR